MNSSPSRRRCSFAAVYLLLLVLCLGLGISTNLQSQNPPPSPERLALSSSSAQRFLQIRDGTIVKTEIFNPLTGHQHDLPGAEFVIYLKDRKLPAAAFQVKGVRTEPGHVVVELAAASPPMTVLLHYASAADTHYLRKWIELRPAGRTAVFVDRLDLENFKPWRRPESFSGPGQPVYVEDAFFGVAYPSSENQGTDELVVCGYLIGRTVDETGCVSREAVFGVAPAGKVRTAFLDCLDRMRPRKVRPFLLWNTWYDLFNYRDEDVIAGIRGLKTGLVNPFGIKLDSVVLDDGWDDFRELWRPHRDRFPRGFSPVQAAAAEIGARLGLWMSPLGGYAANQLARLALSLGGGYERSPRGFCIAGYNYQKLFSDRMVAYIRENHVNYFKLDNLTISCPNPRHGHRSGKYGQVGLTDAFLEVMAKARAADPQVMINITVGSWLSPWWLLSCDVVWRGEMDFGFAGAGSLRQRNLTYVDQVLYKRLRMEKVQFPLNSIMTHGIIKGRRQSFGEKGENLRDFSDDVWMYFGRGVMMQELYLSPDLLSQKEWKVLAAAIRFARDHADLLSRGEMILGEPAAGEVYGFYHEGREERLFVLRNPRPTAQEFPAGLLEKAVGGRGDDRETEGAARCQVIYSSTSRGVADPLDSLESRLILCSRSG